MRRLLLVAVLLLAVLILAVTVLDQDPTPAPPTPEAEGEVPAGARSETDRAETQPTPSPIAAHGRIVRLGSGEPVAEAEVSIADVTVQSGENGEFAFEEIIPGEIELRIVAEGLPPHVTTRILTAYAPDLGEIAIPAQTLLRGTVFSTGSTPIAGARIRILERGRYDVGTWWQGPKFGQLEVATALLDEGKEPPGMRITSDAEGKFEVRGLSPGLYYVDATAGGFAPASNPYVKIPEAGQGEVQLQLPAGTEIRGRVVDPKGAGAGAARVMALPWDEAVEIPYAPLFSTASAPDGGFTLSGVAPGDTYLILARAANGMIGIGMRIPAPSNDVEIRVGPRFTLRGTVVDDETGAAVEGAALFSLLGFTTSDQNGAYVLTGVIRSPFFRYVWITAEGYEEEQAEIDLASSLLGGPEVGADFRLTRIRPGNLVVTARDLSGAPLSGVALLATEWGEEEVKSRGVTRADGTGFLTGVPPHSAELKALKPGYVLAEVFSREAGEEAGAPTDSVTVQVPPGGESAVTITLVKAARVAGLVSDPSGSPLSGVLAYLPYGSADGSTTNEKGRFEIDRLAGGLSTPIRFLKPGYIETTVVAKPGSGVDLEVTLHPGGTLSGRVLSESGEPLAGVEIVPQSGGEETRDKRATTAADGTFMIEGLPTGKHVLLARREGLAPRKSPPIDLRAGESREGIEIVLGEGIRVVIEAVLTDGTEVPAAAVLYGPLERPETERLIFRNGPRQGEPLSFQLPPGRYRIVATPLDGELDAGAQEWEQEFLREGAVRVVLRPGRKRIEIETRVPAGRNLMGMYVQRTEPAQPSLTLWFPVSEKGRLRSPALPPGKYSVTVYISDGENNWETFEFEGLEPSEKAVEVVLGR
jgi:Carboxypeptidase regulatory-like domain